MSRNYGGREHHKCYYCGWDRYTDEPGKALGRCGKCKSSYCVEWPKREDGYRDYSAHTALTVRCRCRTSERLTFRVREEYRLQVEARADLEQHTQEKHRAQEIASRMATIERYARSGARRGHGLTDAEWATDELAIEYRALMREWWALPSVPNEAYNYSPSAPLLLTAKGRVNQMERSDIPESYTLPWAKAVAREWPNHWDEIRELPRMAGGAS